MCIRFLWGTGHLGKNDVTWGQANSTGVPPDPKSKQSRVTNLSLNKHWIRQLCILTNNFVRGFLLLWIEPQTFMYQIFKLRPVC
jgi:hypothetical protein